MAKGVIYILINEAMPGYTKIGKTTNSIEKRMADLDTSGVPLPFECTYAARVADADYVEKKLHDAFEDSRVRHRREFFRIAPERVRAALELAALEDITPKDDVVADADDKAALIKARTIRSNFNFKLADVPAGATLTFTKDKAIMCKVLGPRKIHFEGKEMSLSRAASLAARRLGYKWDNIAGPLYWQYDGETLDERRRRIEQED